MNMGRLNIPIYLNQKIVFDMLATLEDGFSQFTTIQTSSESSSTYGGEASAEIGASNVFALLGVKLRGALKDEDTTKGSEMLSQQKVHTPSSLFQKLRDYLETENQIKHVSNLSNVVAGDFIELEGALIKNPLVSMIDSFIQMMELVAAFSDPKAATPKQGGTGNQQNKKITTQMKALLDGLQTGDIVDLICYSKNGSQNVTTVLPVYNEYFFNRNMNEITDGQYKIIGKVTKVIENSEDSINLLRNTSFSLMQQSFLDSMFEGFKNEDVQKAGMNIPNISTVVAGSAIMVLPIAIFI